jgi:hypothetical protein
VSLYSVYIFLCIRCYKCFNILSLLFFTKSATFVFMCFVRLSPSMMNMTWWYTSYFSHHQWWIWSGGTLLTSLTINDEYGLVVHFLLLSPSMMNMAWWYTSYFSHHQWWIWPGGTLLSCYQKCISTRHETGQKSVPKAHFSTGF